MFLKFTCYTYKLECIVCSIDYTRCTHGISLRTWRQFTVDRKTLPCLSASFRFVMIWGFSVRLMKSTELKEELVLPWFCDIRVCICIISVECLVFAWQCVKALCFLCWICKYWIWFYVYLIFLKIIYCTLWH